VGDIWATDRLILFLAFVIPGFISLKSYQLLFPGEVQPTSEQLIDAVAYSAINYALLSVPIIAVARSDWLTLWPWAYYLFFAFVVFIAPIVWVAVWKFLRGSKLLQKYAPHPVGKPWDYVFAKKEPYWVKVHLKDGTVVAGKYGYRSFSSSAPAEDQIYLEESWVLKDNGAFERPIRRTAGVIVTGEIVYIEFRTLYDQQQAGEQDDGKERSGAGDTNPQGISANAASGSRVSTHG
jgi:Family of unknown function (DUF6338)